MLIHPRYLHCHQDPNSFQNRSWGMKKCTLIQYIQPLFQSPAMKCILFCGLDQRGDSTSPYENALQIITGNQLYWKGNHGKHWIYPSSTDFYLNRSLSQFKALNSPLASTSLSMQVTTSPEFGRWIKHSLSSYSLLYPHGFWLLLENILLFSWFLSSTPQKVQKRQSFINPHNTKSASIPSLHNKEFWKWIILS